MVFDKIFEIIAVIFVISVLLTATVTYQATETYKEGVPLAYQVIDSRLVDHATFFGLWHSQQAEVTIKNTDNESGSFAINFVFKNDRDVRTATQKTDLLAGETKTIYVDSPLAGNLTVQAAVLPGMKYVEKTRTVTKEKPLLDPNVLNWFPSLKIRKERIIRIGSAGNFRKRYGLK